MVALIASRRLNREWRQVLTNHGLGQPVGDLSGETSIPVLKNHDPGQPVGNLSGETKVHSEAMTYRTSAAWSRADCHPEVEQEMEAGSCEPRPRAASQGISLMQDATCC